ncbi:hypothetical protein D3C77_460320 [compost metagenome]
MNIATWPGDSLSLYWSTFCAVMVYSGFSLAYGSDRKPLASTVPAFLPSGFQALIEPSALPAFSAPIGVSVEPSLAASSADTAAMTLVASSDRPSTPACSRFLVIFIVMLVLNPCS